MFLRFRYYFDSASGRLHVSLLEMPLEAFTVKHIKKMMFAALAALMVAGTLCSISGATSLSSLGPIAVVGEGVSPLPAAQAPAPDQPTTSIANGL